jgi:tetratricopeptide (TPR) repeat protein
LDKHKIDRIIENPQLLIQQESEELVRISDQFPFFNAAQIILARSYQQRGDYRFTDQLHQAAVYANNRHVLYNWVQTPLGKIEQERDNDLQLQNEATTENDLKPNISLEPATNDDSVLASLILRDEAEENISQPILSVAEIPTEAEIMEGEPEALVTVALIEDEVEEIAIEGQRINPMEEQILLEALQRSIEIEVTPEVSKSEEKTSEAKTEELEEEDPSTYASWMLKRSKALHFGESSVSMSGNNEVPEAAQDWIRHVVETGDEKRGFETSQEIDETDFLPTNRLSHGAKKIQVTDAKSHQKDLIDRFIKLEPNISRGKISEYAAGNVAKESLEEDYSIVTETIAQLYAKQGKFDKAKKAYRKLIELYPEKSVYFAAQLKNLDKPKK